MDIERLKELKKAVDDYLSGCSLMTIEHFDMILALIDSAMQPVSEDVQRAIGDLQGVSGILSYALYSGEEDGQLTAKIPEYLGSLDLAIQALKQYKPVPEIDPNLGQAESEV